MKELLKVMQENPELPVKFFTYGGVSLYNRSYWLTSLESIKIVDCFVIDSIISEKIYMYKDDYLELIENKYEYSKENALERFREFDLGPHIIVFLGVPNYESL